MAGTGDEIMAQEELAVVCQPVQVPVDSLKKELHGKNEECEILRAKIARLELDLVEARMKTSQNQSEASEVHQMKEASEELLTKAKSIIFEKVKLCKNQELQIEALQAQVSSLKDVVGITKNLLEIRNMEVTHMQDQINAMNGKVAAEKERQDLVHSKLDRMIRMNAELKREYETQLVLFNALRDRYSERELAKGLVKPKQVEAKVEPKVEPTKVEPKLEPTTVEEKIEPKVEEPKVEEAKAVTESISSASNESNGTTQSDDQTTASLSSNETTAVVAGPELQAKTD